MRKFIYIIGLVAILYGCKNDIGQPVKTKKEIIKAEQNVQDDVTEKLIDYMGGYFTSQKQALADTSYYNIKLKMVPIWQNRTDGHYLYVEQALATNDKKPYRQRVYHVVKNGDEFVSKVYTIPNEERYIRSWKNTDAFKNLVPDSLIEREGCEVVLKYHNGSFKGSTGETSCKSTLRGATYATSEVEVFENKIISWDRGFDNDGEQVWGAEEGGYVFDKVATMLKQ